MSYVSRNSKNIELLKAMKEENAYLKLQLQQHNLKQKVINTNLHTTQQNSSLNLVKLKLKTIHQRGDHQELIFTKTSKAILKVGNAVINESGIIGTVTSVGTEVHVKSFVDTSNTFGVVHQKSGQNYIAKGLGYDNSFELLFVPENSNINIGDKIYTSGMGLFTPAGHLIGKVSLVDNLPGSNFSTVRVKVKSNPSYGTFYAGISLAR